MANTENNKEQKADRISDQEQLAQIALGNTQAIRLSTDNNNELLTTPKTSGTGGNPSSAASHSLIVRENSKGEHSYEEGGSGDGEEKK